MKYETQKKEKIARYCGYGDKMPLNLAILNFCMIPSDIMTICKFLNEKMDIIAGYLKKLEDHNLIFCFQ